MERYQLRDLLVICEDNSCKFGILNNAGDKIKIITKNEIHAVEYPLDKHWNRIGGLVSTYAYTIEGGILAYPLIMKGAQANEVEKKHGGNFILFDGDEDHHQIIGVLAINKLSRAINIISALYGIDKNYDFENTNRNRFVTPLMLEKIEKAIDFAISQNGYSIQKEKRINAQDEQNKKLEEGYSAIKEF